MDSLRDLDLSVMLLCVCLEICVCEGEEVCDGNRRGRTKKRLSDPLQLGGVGGFANALHITHGGENAERQHMQTRLA